MPAAIAFAALGALLTGAVLLLLLNPRSRGVRWWIGFQGAQIAWLGAQGWALATGLWEPAGTIVSVAVHLLPALFVAYALVELQRGLKRPALAGWAVVAFGVLTVPLSLAAEGASELAWFIPVWHVTFWSAGSVILVRWNRQARARAEVNHRLGLLVIGLLVVVGPLALAGYVVFGRGMWLYAMPILVVWMQFLVFVGVARLRFYDIDIRLRRSGEIAAEAAEQSRLAVLEEVTASLAHEIRNPLTGVRSLAQRLAEEEIDAPSRRRYGRVILDEVGRVEGLVTNLLGLARRTPAQQGQPTLITLGSLFEDLILLLSSRAARGGVTLDGDANGIEAVAQREPLAQILLNLLLNAISQSPPGSTVHVEATRSGDDVVITVRDEGAGIPAGDGDRIWEPFHSGTGGTGLGLAVVRRMTRENGWRVEAGEAPGGGAEFRVQIPSARPRPVGELEVAAS